MPTFLVEWSIEIDAESPEEAAQIAHCIQLDEHSLATTFYVTWHGGETAVDTRPVEERGTMH